jgi:hypothetical protein
MGTSGIMGLLPQEGRMVLCIVHYRPWAQISVFVCVYFFSTTGQRIRNSRLFFPRAISGIDQFLVPASEVNSCPYPCPWGSGPHPYPRPWIISPVTLILVLVFRALIRVLGGHVMSSSLSEGSILVNFAGACAIKMWMLLS